MKLKKEPKFQVGDVLIYKIDKMARTVWKVDVDSYRTYYLAYNDIKDNYGFSMSFIEASFELDPICRTPLFKALS